MDDAACVRRLEGVGDLLCDAGRGRRGEAAALAQHGGQIAAGDQLHDDEGPGRIRAVVEDLDDVRMVQRGGGLRLVAEARQERRIGAVLGAQQLDRHVAAELASWAR